MTYLTITHVPGGDLVGFQSILDAMPETQPAGLLARYAGQAGDEFVITGVWTSKASWDRFATETLGPAARAAGAHSTLPPHTVEYEAADELLTVTTGAQ